MRYYRNGNRFISTEKSMDLEEITKEEFDNHIINVKTKQAKQYRIEELKRPKTYDEGVRELNKVLLNQQLKDSEDKTLAISCMAMFDVWTNGVYEVGDVRTDPTTLYPYECIMAHDSLVNTTWDISVRTLWKPYHSRKKEYALPYEQPTGSHDMYHVGEYCVIEEYIYKCIQDTNFSPNDYAQAWEIVE